ncbi:MAG: alpha/beta fold hydrolase, partial [Cyanobacteria bacterium J06632_3]
RITQDGLLDAVRTEVARARSQYDSVGIYGHSMGGAISLILASEGLVDACAVSAPAIKLPWQADVLVPLIGWMPFTLSAPTNDPFYLPSYQFHHSYAVRALLRLSQQATRQLSDITCPVLGVHTHRDQTIPPVVLDIMQRQIQAPLETEWFDPSSHAMPLDMKGEDMSQSVAAFLQRQLFPMTLPLSA